MNVDVVLSGLGVAGGAVLRACQSANLAVCIVEEDEATLARVCEMLARGTDGDFRRTTDLSAAKAPVLIAASDPDLQGPPPTLIILWIEPTYLAGCMYPARCVAADLSSPDFVEVFPGQADHDACAAATALLQRLGAEVVQSLRPGQFAGTFLLDRALALSDRLMLAGIAPWELDEALQDAGFADGLLAGQDQVGLDVAFARRSRAGQTLLVSDRMVREGRLGRAVGVGWYRYPGGGGAVIDPLMEDMIVEEARFAGLARGDMTQQAAADALVLGLLNAAAVLIGDGMLPVVVDRICARKMGFSDLTAAARRWPGDILVRALEDLSSLDPALWAPVPSLRAPKGDPKT